MPRGNDSASTHFFVALEAQWPPHAKCHCFHSPVDKINRSTRHRGTLHIKASVNGVIESQWLIGVRFALNMTSNTTSRRFGDERRADSIRPAPAVRDGWSAGVNDDGASPRSATQPLLLDDDLLQDLRALEDLEVRIILPIRTMSRCLAVLVDGLAPSPSPVSQCRVPVHSQS